MMHSVLSDVVTEELICWPDDEACILEVYSTPPQEHICQPASLALPDDVYVDISLEQDSVSFDQLATTRRAATQVLPLLSSVYEDRSSSEAACGGLSWEYRSALSGDSTDNRVCLMCGNSFLSPTKLLHHAILQHRLTQLKIQQCFVCRQAYVFPEALVSHLQDFHGLPFPQLTCPVCYSQLSSRSELKAHTRKHGLSEACLLCFQHFPSRHQLAEHTDTCHAKPFPCTSCRQGFCNEEVLKRHECRHVATSDLLCECGFRAAPELPDREWSLLEHLQQCKPAHLKTLMTENAAEDQEEAALDELLSLYHQHQVTEESQEVEQCVANLVSTVASLSNNDDQQIQLAPDEDPQLTCQLCSDRRHAFQCSSDSVVSHLSTSHPRSKLCPFCRKRFSCATTARSHAKKHAHSIETLRMQPDEHLFCPHCHKTFTKKGKLNWHLEYHHKLPGVEKPHKCPSCPRKFLYAASRDKHAASHALGEVVNPGSKTPQVLKCEFCPCKFIKPSYLQRHKQKYHTLEESSHFECHHCGSVVKTLNQLRRHITYRHGPSSDKQRFACPYCPIGCRTAVGLRTHLRVHTGETPFECVYCSKGFKRKHALTAHLRSIHSIVDPSLSSSQTIFSCTECPFKLPQHSGVVKHFLRAHRNLRRFVCGLCGERYCQNQELKQHMASKHSTGAPSIPRENRHDQTHVYVFPGIDKLPSSHPHAMLISQIVDDEKLKTENLPYFPCEPNHVKDDSSGDKEPTSAPTVINTTKENISTTSKKEKVTSLVTNPILEDVIVLPPVENCEIMSKENCAKIQELPPAADEPVNMLLDPCAAERVEIPSYTVWIAPEPAVVTQQPPEVVPFILKIPDTIVIGEDGTVKPLKMNQETKPAKSTKPKNNSQRYKCPKCDKSFVLKRNLELHSKVHTDERKFSCTICKKSFKEKHNVTVHMRSHTGDKPYVCQECGKTYRYHQELEDHMRGHRGERPFSCSQCPNRTFVRIKDLRRHEKTTHSLVSKIKCALCEKLFARKDAFEVHMKCCHTNIDKPFKCSICQHSFVSEKMLQQHKMLHSGSKDHVCSKCNKAFATRGYLQGHLRTHARQANYIQCSLCPRKFSTEHNLQAHVNAFHDKLTMQRKRQEQQQLLSESGNLEVDFDLPPLELAPGESDIQVVYLQVLSESDLDILPSPLPQIL